MVINELALDKIYHYKGKNGTVKQTQYLQTSDMICN